MRNNVLIMLSTYNGAKYLREQLDSLYAQEGVEIHILVRDDGSKDNTINILKEYQQEYGKMTLNAEENIGAARSFYKLLLKAKFDFDKFDYYAFCDQDDVWNRNKISYSLANLEEYTGIYKLFYSDVVVTDSTLFPINKRSPHRVDSLQNNIIGNRQLGCTQVFNYELFDKITHGILKAEYIFNSYYPLHDVWTSLVAFAFNADIIYGVEPTMCYRQHEANVVGGESHGFMRTWGNRLKRLRKFSNYKSMKCKYMLNAYDDIPKRSLDILSKCAKYKENGFKGRSQLAFDKSFHCNNFIENLGFITSVLIGKF